MRRIIGSVVLAALGVLAAAHPAQAHAAMDAVDVKAFAGVWNSRTAWAEPLVERPSTFHVGATGPFGTWVRITVDLSNVDTSRVEVTNSDAACRRDGDTLRCEKEISGYNNVLYLTIVDLFMRPLGGQTGPAGYVTAHVEPVDGPDPAPSDNDSRLNIDARVDRQSHFGIKVADAQGAVGDTVTVRVTITNDGPNSLKELVLINPTGGGGKDFAGGDGCTMTPAPECPVPRVPPGTVKTVNLRFHIRRCYRPVPGDPEHGASVDGGLPISFLWYVAIRDLPSDLDFRITVRGCDQNTAPTRPMPTPSLPASPTASPTPEPSSPPASTVHLQAAGDAETPAPQPDPRNASRYRPVFHATGGGLLLGALILAAIRLRRRRDGS